MLNEFQTDEERAAKKPGHVVNRMGHAFLSHENGILLIVLLALIGAMSFVTKGLVTRPTNVINILLQSSIRGIAAVGQTFVVLSANIDISIGGVGLFCSMLGALLMTSHTGQQILGVPVSMYLAIPIMIAAGIGWGVVNGSLVSRLGVPSLIVTLGMWEVTRGAAFRLGEGESISRLPQGLSWIGQGNVAGVPVPFIIFVGVACVAYFVLRYTTFGRSVYAVGGNPVSSRLSGINAKNIYLAVFLISGFCAGLAGVIITSRVMSAAMRTLQGLELDCIAAVFIGGISLSGGKGSLIGAVLGVLIIGIINNGMSVLGADPALQGIVKGTIIVTAVAVDYLRRR